MQELEIKDVQSGATYRIAAQGSVIGREGAKADIIIKNPSVSKRHARIYATDGQWFLEDLGSSNGTFFANQRINEPVPLGPGTLFALAEIQFEVVKKGGANGEERGGRGGRGGGNGDGERDRLRAATAARPDDGEVIGGPTARPSPSRDPFAGGAGGGDDDELATGVGAIMSVIPRAFAHYLVAVPKLALNPIGTVRTSIEEQQHPAMSWWSLAGWAIPPMLLSGAVTVLVSIISMLVAGAFLVGTLIGVIITPAIMIGVALVMALIWHPVMTFLIKLFKGHSDARSRSNYFVIAMTGMALQGIVGGVAALFLLIPVPFIGIAPVLLSLVASLITLYVAYAWWKFFEVHKIVQILLLIGLVLTGLGGLFNIYGVVSGGAAMVAGGGGAAVNTAGMTPEQAKAMADAAAMAAAAGNPEAAKALAEASAAEAMRLADEKVKAAQDAAAKAGADATKVNDAAEKAKAEAAAENVGKDAKMKAEVEKMKAEEARAKEEAEKAKAAAEKQREAAEAAAAAAAEKTKAEAGKTAPDVDDPPARPSGGSGSYVAWAAKRDAVEKAIADDPTLLRKKDVLALYESYTRIAFDVRKGYNSKRNKNEPWRDKIIERQIAAETFDKAKGVIEDLHGKIF